MKLSLFDYQLPSERIAQSPLSCRSSSRLLYANQNGIIEDREFIELPSMLRSNDLLILNDTKVLLARLVAYKEKEGGRVEIFIERQTDAFTCLAQVRASNKVKVGTRLITEEGSKFLVRSQVSAFYELSITSELHLAEVLAREGLVPLPPYIRRAPLPRDRERYQTIYAKEPGAVAAPTAGLHFDDKSFLNLRQIGVAIKFITLHVGAGTFHPIRTDNIYDHSMHSERFSVPNDVVCSINQTRKKGGRVVAVGTTVVRALESAAEKGELAATAGYSSLYITPGYHFKVVDALITNFHQPKSSLFVLVSTFFGLEAIRKIYEHAISNRYRFYSYGDAMFLDGSRS